MKSDGSKVKNFVWKWFIYVFGPHSGYLRFKPHKEKFYIGVMRTDGTEDC